MMRQRPPTKIAGINKNNANGFLQSAAARRAGTKQPNGTGTTFSKRTRFVVLLVLLVATLQLVLNSILHRDGSPKANSDRSDESPHAQSKMNSYDVLLKNSINYQNLNSNATAIATSNLAKLQEQIHNLQSQLSTLESKSQKYTDDPRFFPFVIRDSRHLTPVQIDPDFHVFDYVDLTQAKQPKSSHSQLLHNARLVVDEVLEAKRASQTEFTLKEKRHMKTAEKHEAPCQKYSIECYAQKILQVFSYILRKFPSVEYFFYVEADNNLCVPMTMVKDLALNEKRYFINTGIGFSGWIMSREFLGDFIELYTNATLEFQAWEKKMEKEHDKASKIPKSSAANDKTAAAAAPPAPEVRPDVLASYYLTDKQAWTVTRQYWVSHTTLESLGIASLSVKDRRKEESGERMKLDKHLPRCLEPRRGKWKVSRRRPYIDPRDRFGWDYFDYEVCPDQVLFPCGGPDQLKELVANDWKVANETGALAYWARRAEKKRRIEEAEKKKQRQAEAAAAAQKKETDPMESEEQGQRAEEIKAALEKMKELKIAREEKNGMLEDAPKKENDMLEDAPKKTHKPWQRWKNGVGPQDS